MSCARGNYFAKEQYELQSLSKPLLLLSSSNLFSLPTTPKRIAITERYSAGLTVPFLFLQSPNPGINYFAQFFCIKCLWSEIQAKTYFSAYLTCARIRVGNMCHLAESILKVFSNSRRPRDWR